MPLPSAYVGTYCRRCGRMIISCEHPMHLGMTIPFDRAARIRARYALGERFDPAGHDTNDYLTDPPEATLR